MMLLPAVGQLAQGNANAQALTGEAKAHDYNAAVADVNAATAYQQGSAAEEQSRRESRNALGEQRAAVAESGTGFGGSNAAIMAQSAAKAELDALNIRYGAQVEATGYKNESQAERFNAKLRRGDAKRAKRLGYLNATTSLVESVGKVASYAAGGV